MRSRVVETKDNGIRRRGRSEHTEYEELEKVLEYVLTKHGALGESEDTGCEKLRSRKTKIRPYQRSACTRLTWTALLHRTEESSVKRMRAGDGKRDRGQYGFLS